jgi:hypothetical protein
VVLGAFLFQQSLECMKRVAKQLQEFYKGKKLCWHCGTDDAFDGMGEFQEAIGKTPI